jgi:hypothetical protein
LQFWWGKTRYGPALRQGNVVPHSVPVPTRCPLFPQSMHQLQNPTEWTTKLEFKQRLLIWNRKLVEIILVLLENGTSNVQRLQGAFEAKRARIEILSRTHINSLRMDKKKFLLGILIS